MFQSRYDKARKYVRYAGTEESWEYGQYILSLDVIDKAMLGDIYDNDEEQYVALRLFNVAFFVDLHRTGRLSTFIQKTQPPGTDIIAADWRPPKYTPGAKQYRFSVYLD